VAGTGGRGSDILVAGTGGRGVLYTTVESKQVFPFILILELFLAIKEKLKRSENKQNSEFVALLVACLRVWLRLFFKVFFTQKCIKIIFFFIFFISAHQNDLKTSKKY